MYQQVELLEMSKSNFITLNQAKQYLRIEHVHDDEMIQDMIEIALIAAENYIGLKLQESKWKITIYDDLPSVIKIANGPIAKLESFKITRHTGEVSYLSNEFYILDQFAENIKMRRHYSIQKTEITYQIGYENGQLPAPIKQGLLEHLAKLYDLRGSDQALPISAKSLYQAYKRVRF